jgi:hypothetical protein
MKGLPGFPDGFWFRIAIAALPLISLPAAARQALPSEPAAIPIINVKEFGAKGDGRTDDTAILQGLLDTGTWPLVLYLPGTKACYRISRALVVPDQTVNGYTAKRSVYFIGDGPEHTELLQTNSSADGIDLSFGSTPPVNSGLWSGGGVIGMTIAAGSSCIGPGLTTATLDSSGDAINLQNGNNAVVVDNVYWKGFRVGLNLDRTWQGYFTRLWGVGQSIGIQVGCNTNFVQGAGNSFAHILLSDYAFDPAVSASSIGFKVCSGAQYLDHVELDNFLHGLLVQPAAGQQVEGMSLADVIADTSLGDGAVFDGGAGSIAALRISNSWFSFNNGAGLVIKGAAGHVQGITVAGSHFRENGLAGIEDQIDAELSVTGSDITGNDRGMFMLATAGAGCQSGHVLTVQGGGQPSGSHATTIDINRVSKSGEVLANGFTVDSAGFYSHYPLNPVRVSGGHCTIEPTFNLTRPARYNPGIHVAANVGAWSVVGNFFGNFATNSRSQAADIVIDRGTSSDATYRANTTKAPAPGSGIPHVVNGSTAHIDWDEELYAVGRSHTAGGRTVYLGPGGGAASGDVGFLAGGGVLTEMECRSSRAPGSGQSYTFQPYNPETGAVGTAVRIIDQRHRTGITPESVALSEGGSLLIRVVTSRTAIPATFGCRLGIAH